jgi:hypothetical protein
MPFKVNIMQIHKIVKDMDSRETVINGVLGFLENHPEEIFWYNDKEILTAFPDVNRSTIDWALWELAKENKISRIKIGGSVYFGTHSAIQSLCDKLGTSR